MNNINEKHGILLYDFADDIVKLYEDANNILINDSNYKTLREQLNGDILCDVTLHTLNINLKKYKFSELLKMNNYKIKITIKNYHIKHSDGKKIKKLLKRGSENFSNYDFFDNNILNFSNNINDIIEIDCCAINNQIYAKHFFELFVHEFNHIYHYYKTNNIENIYKHTINLNKFNKHIDDLFNDDDNIAIKIIFNILFDDSELNARAAGFFGELLSNKIKINNYQFIDYDNNSDVLDDLELIKNSIKHIKTFNKRKITTLYTICKIYNYRFNNILSLREFDDENKLTDKALESFKRLFISKCNSKYSKLYMMIQKIYAMYKTSNDSMVWNIAPIRESFIIKK